MEKKGEKERKKEENDASWWKVLVGVALLLFFSAMAYGGLRYMGLGAAPEHDLEKKLKMVSPSEQIEETEKEITVAKKAHPDVARLNLKVDLDPLDFNLASELDATKIFTSRAVYNYTDLEPELRESYTDEANLAYEAAGEENTHIFNWSDMVARYDLFLTDPKLPTVLDLKVGSGDGEAALQETTLERASAEVGAGELDFGLRAPNNAAMSLDFSVGSGKAEFTGLAYANLAQLKGELGSGEVALDFSGDTDGDLVKEPVKADIRVGAGVMTVILPRDYGYSIKHKIGDGRIKAGDEKKLKGTDEFESENYGEAEFKIDFDVTLGSGTIVFE